jgi:hypothetical protein
MTEIDELHYYCMDDVGWQSLEAVLWIRIRIGIHIKVKLDPGFEPLFGSKDPDPRIHASD